MREKIDKILLESFDPSGEIVKIIDSKDDEIKRWKILLAFFIVVFIGWYCIHVAVNHGSVKQKSCAEKDTTIAQQKVVINYITQLNKNAVYFKDIQ